jgi:hypothetical protein
MLEWLTKGVRGLVGPAILVITTVFPRVAPEAAAAVGDGVLKVLEGLGAVLTTLGVGRKVASTVRHRGES